MYLHQDQMLGCGKGETLKEMEIQRERESRYSAWVINNVIDQLSLQFCSRWCFEMNFPVIFNPAFVSH